MASRHRVRITVAQDEGGWVGGIGWSGRTGIHNVPEYAPPSISRFWPVMYPACWLHRNAQAAPNSAGSPKRPAGTVAAPALEPPRAHAAPVRPGGDVGARAGRCRTRPGRRLLMRHAVPRRPGARAPPTKPVSPARAPFDRPRMRDRRLHRRRGDVDDAAEALRPIMPSTARISAIGASMLASSAASQASRSQSRKSPGRRAAGIVDQDVGLRAGGERGARPASVAMSPATTVTTDAGLGADLRGGRLQRLRAARVDRHGDALAGERLRRRPGRAPCSPRRRSPGAR